MARKESGKNGFFARCLRRGREHGVALILSLGVMALLLIIAMSFAFNSRQSLTFAKVDADYARADTLLHSIYQRLRGMLSREMSAEYYPRKMFYKPTTGSAWDFHPMIGSFDDTPWPPSPAAPNSENDTHRAGLDEAFATTIVRSDGSSYVVAGSNDDNPLPLPYDPEIDRNIGWNLVEVSADLTNDGRARTDPPIPNAADKAENVVDSIVGRYAYYLFDQTGKLDPNAVLDAVTADTQKTRPSLGISVREMVFRKAFPTGAPGPEALAWDDVAYSFQHSNHGDRATLAPLPTARWTSFENIFTSNPRIKATPPFTALEVAEAVIQVLFPYTIPDKEQFWNDFNADDVVDAFELRNRLDITKLRAGISATAPNFSAKKIYNVLVGYDNTDNPNRDDKTKFAPPIKAWLARPTVPDTAVMGRRIAAQMAVLMLDWVDTNATTATDYEATPDALFEDVGYVASTTPHALRLNGDFGSDEAPASPIPANTESLVYGMEGTCGLSELAVQLLVTPRGVDTAITVAPPKFKIELFRPFSEDDYEAKTEIKYRVKVANTAVPTAATVTSASYRVQLTTTTEINQQSGAGAADGGKLRFSSSFATGSLLPAAAFPTNIIDRPGFFPLGADWQLAEFVIEELIVWYRPLVVGAKWRRVRKYPVNVDGPPAVPPPPNDFLIMDGNTVYDETTGPKTLYYKLAARDVMFSDRDGPDTDFADYWSKLPAGATTDTAEPSPLSIGNSATVFALGYESANYCDVAEPADALFTHLREIGRLHSPAPGAAGRNKSVQLWTRTAANLPPDRLFLEVFKVGDGGQSGRISINSRVNPALHALFGGLGFEPGADERSARKALKVLNNPVTATAESVFPLRNRSDIGRIFSVAIDAGNGENELFANHAANKDLEVENIVGEVVQLVQARDQYYTAVVVAQAVRDLGWGDLARNIPGAVKVKEEVLLTPPPPNPDPDLDRFVRILAEQKGMAIMHRDAWTKKVRILRLSKLE